MSDRRSERVLLMDLHGQWHDESGNLLGKDECGWERCEFWPVAVFARSRGKRWELPEEKTT